MRSFHCLTYSHGRVNFVVEVEVEVGGVDKWIQGKEGSFFKKTGSRILLAASVSFFKHQ